MTPRAKLILAHVVFLASGVCGLGCQMIWTRMFGLGLGQEMPAVLAVVAAFFGGFALGAAVLDRWLAGARHPAGVYATLELAIGLWILASVQLIAVANQLALDWIGLEPSAIRHAAVAFGVPFLALLPATAAMGATLPAMECFARQLRPREQSVGSLYAANTFGAVLGTLGSTFWLVPELGARKSLTLFAGLNLLCAAAILGVVGLGKLARSRRADRSAQECKSDETRSSQPSPASLSNARLRVTLLATGLLGIGLEVLGVRMLKLVLEDTVFTFACVVAVYLFGTALGAALSRRLWPKLSAARRLEYLLPALAGACAVAGWVLVATPSLHAWLRSLAGASLGGVALAESVTAAALFLPPTLAMGATFATLAEAAREHWGGVGRALAWNTLGGALAPAVIGLGLFPALGAKWTLAVLAGGYWLLQPRPRSLVRPVPPLLLALALVCLPDLSLLRLLPGERVRRVYEGVSDSVAVIETADGHRTLRVNNRFTMGGTASANAERRQALLPLLLHPHPQRALFLGSATGITAAGATAYPGLQVDSVELVPEVVAAMPAFAPENFAAPDRLRQFTADARRFMRTTTNRYDVIVADLFHPARDGAGALYTREHFAAVKGRLNAGGLFCQWLPLYQLDEAVLKVILATFAEVFPEMQVWLLRLNLDTPVIGLVGAGDAVGSANSETFRHNFRPDWFAERLRDPRLREALKPLGLAEPYQCSALLLAADRAALRPALSEKPSSDDRPRVSFLAPMAEASRAGAPYGLLFRVLEWVSSPADDSIGTPGAVGSDGLRLRACLAARNQYLRGLRLEAEARPADALAACVESARLSADFTTGYAYVLTLAVQMSKDQPATARQWLERLAEVRPERPVARELLERLFQDDAPAR